MLEGRARLDQDYASKLHVLVYSMPRYEVPRCELLKGRRRCINCFLQATPDS